MASQNRPVRLILARLVAVAIACGLPAPASAQPPMLGPTTSQALPSGTTWPAAPPSVAVARLVAEELAAAGWPAVFWSQDAPPPPDGWRLYGEVVNLDEGNAVARNMVGFGACNATLGIDIALADPATAGGRPFFVLDSSDRGRRGQRPCLGACPLMVAISYSAAASRRP